MNAVIPVIVGLVTILMLAMMVIFLSIIRLWVRAMTSGVPVSVLRIVSMRLRGNSAQLLIDAHVLQSKAGIRASLDEVESVYMQNLNRVRMPEELVRLVKDHQAKK